MKVTASVAALAFATAAVAVPWVAETTTTTTVAPKATSTVWDDWTTTTTTTKKPVDPATTSTVWADWTSTTTTTKPVDPATVTTWADWEEPDSWTTTVVTAITTFVPAPTHITHAGKTWTVTGATTLTITDCPCTVSVPVFTKIATSCSETVPAGATATTWADWESTTVAPTSVVAASYTGVKPAAATYTGAANALVANVGAGLAGVGAIAAFLL